MHELIFKDRFGMKGNMIRGTPFYIQLMQSFNCSALKCYILTKDYQNRFCVFELVINLRGISYMEYSGTLLTIIFI